MRALLFFISYCVCPLTSPRMAPLFDCSPIKTWRSGPLLRIGLPDNKKVSHRAQVGGRSREGHVINPRRIFCGTKKVESFQHVSLFSMSKESVSGISLRRLLLAEKMPLQNDLKRSKHSDLKIRKTHAEWLRSSAFLLFPSLALLIVFSGFPFSALTQCKIYHNKSSDVYAFVTEITDCFATKTAR